MKEKICVLLIVCCFSFIFVGLAQAVEPVPHASFVKYTEAALDVIDELDVAFSSLSGATKPEAKRLINKLDACLKKYDRYVKQWPDGEQGRIVSAIMQTGLAYDIVLLEGLHGKTHAQAKQLSQRSRDLFAAYMTPH